jgi:hypothetical protein
MSGPVPSRATTHVTSHITLLIRSCRCAAPHLTASYCTGSWDRTATVPSLSLSVAAYHSLSLPIAPYRSLSLPIAPYRSLSLPIAPYRSLALFRSPSHFIALCAPSLSVALDHSLRSLRSLTLPLAPAGSPAPTSPARSSPRLSAQG